MKSGEERLREAIGRLRSRQKPAKPEALGPDWAVWIESRLDRLESRQKWILGLSIAILAAVLGLKPELLAQIAQGIQ